MNYYFMDTSALMHNYVELEEMLQDKNNKLVITTTVLEELDNHKDGSDKEKAFLARKAFKLLNSNPEGIKYVIDEVPNEFIAATIFYGYNMRHNDNKILYSCYNFMQSVEDGEVIFVTNDNGLIVKCTALNIPCLRLKTSLDDESYKGFIEIEGTEQENDEKLLEFIENKSLYANQYVIIRDIDTKEESVVRWDAELEDFVDIYFKSKVKPLNVYQKAAMDLMYNDNIPIKVICGQMGSGKSLISVTMAEEKMYQGRYSTLMLVRNPVAVDNLDIGALPGSKFQKTSMYFNSMLQYLTNESMINGVDAFDPDNEELNKRRGYNLEMDCVQFLKGISVKDTMVLCDECEDLSVKLIKTLGTRIGKNSTLVLMGDKKQAEKQYRSNNGVAAFIEYAKGNPLVGIIYLPEDVRSEASKLFAEMPDK
jgi:PhoH-like ATPase